MTINYSEIPIYYSVWKRTVVFCLKTAFSRERLPKICES
jgi:hypothetical protein